MQLDWNCIWLAGAPENFLFNFCGCGWPQHMLLPRGKQEGMAFELFVMVTDWSQDKVCAYVHMNIVDVMVQIILVYVCVFN